MPSAAGRLFDSLTATAIKAGKRMTYRDSTKHSIYVFCAANGLSKRALDPAKVFALIRAIGWDTDDMVVFERIAFFITGFVIRNVTAASGKLSQALVEETATPGKSGAVYDVRWRAYTLAWPAEHVIGFSYAPPAGANLDAYRGPTVSMASPTQATCERAVVEIKRASLGLPITEDSDEEDLVSGALASGSRGQLENGQAEETAVGGPAEEGREVEEMTAEAKQSEAFVAAFGAAFGPFKTATKFADDEVMRQWMLTDPAAPRHLADAAGSCANSADMERVVEERNMARDQLAETQRQLDAVNRVNTTSTTKTQKEIDNARTQLSEVQAQLDSAKATTTKIQQERDNAQHQLSVTQRQLEAVNKVNTTSTTEIQKERDIARNQLSEVQAQLDSAKATTTKIQQERDNAQHQLFVTQQHMSRTQQDLDRATELLNTTMSKVEKERKQAARELFETRQQLADARKQLGAAIQLPSYPELAGYPRLPHSFFPSSSPPHPTPDALTPPPTAKPSKSVKFGFDVANSTASPPSSPVFGSASSWAPPLQRPTFGSPSPTARRSFVGNKKATQSSPTLTVKDEGSDDLEELLGQVRKSATPQAPGILKKGHFDVGLENTSLPPPIFGSINNNNTKAIRFASTRRPITTSSTHEDTAAVESDDTDKTSNASAAAAASSKKKAKAAPVPRVHHTRSRGGEGLVTGVTK